MAAVTSAPAVSIIVIFLDAERHLRDAVESVLMQDTDDLEVILVDDGSQDRSGAIARELAARDPSRIRLLEHPDHAHCGTGASRDLGLRAARGRFVAFLDADDQYLADRLATHLRVLESSPEVDAVLSESLVCIEDATGRVIAEHRVAPRFWPEGVTIMPPEVLVARMLVPESGIGICNITLRRTLALEVGGFDQAFDLLYEDQAFLTRLLLRARVRVIHRALARVRVGGGQGTRSTLLDAHRRDGIWQVSTRRFLAWQAATIRGTTPMHPALAHALARLEVDAERMHRLGVLTAIRQRINAIAVALLPARLYRAAFACYRAGAERAARARFAQLSSEFRG